MQKSLKRSILCKFEEMNQQLVKYIFHLAEHLMSIKLLISQ
jgi:hypothetical protein